MCHDCYVTDVIYSIYSLLRTFRAHCKEVYGALMQHISRIGSDCLIFIDFTSHWNVSVKVSPFHWCSRFCSAFYAALRHRRRNFCETSIPVYDPIKLKLFCTQKRSIELKISIRFHGKRKIIAIFSLFHVKLNLYFFLVLFGFEASSWEKVLLIKLSLLFLFISVLPSPNGPQSEYGLTEEQVAGKH